MGGQEETSGVCSEVGADAGAGGNAGGGSEDAGKERDGGGSVTGGAMEALKINDLKVPELKKMLQECGLSAARLASVCAHTYCVCVLVLRRT
jgi:hypothetical protein